MPHKAEIVIRVALDVSDRTKYKSLRSITDYLEALVVDRLENRNAAISAVHSTVRTWGER